MATFLAYFFYFVAASASPLQRRWLATRENIQHDGQIHFTFKVTFITVILSFLLPLFNPLFISGNIYKIITLTIIAGLFGAGFFASLYTAQSQVEAGISSLVNNIYTPITIVLATLFLNEKLSMIQIFGTALLLVGIVVVSKKHRVGRFKFDKYFMLVLLSGIFLGFCLVAERALQKTTGFTAGTMLSWWSQCAFLGLATLVTKSKNKYSRKTVAISGILAFLHSLSWVVLIFVVGNLSLVSAVTTFKVVVIFLTAAIFLNEREDLPRKTIGSLIALCGLLLMR